MKQLTVLLIIFLCCCKIQAQPFTFKSVDEPKEFRLKIHYANEGKGAFVQYMGQKGIISLKQKSYVSDTTGRGDGQPDLDTFVWDEIIDGKVNGTYGLTETLRDVYDVWYIRKKDNKRFRLELVEDEKTYDGTNQLLLHGALFSFNHYYDDLLQIKYPDGKTENINLPPLETESMARQVMILDYNFDGYDDISFSIPDAGMGVYRFFTIWIYNPKTKLFEQLEEPDYSNSQCSCLCDVNLDKRKKLLKTACRGGAKWWEDVYQFKNGKLVWVNSSDLTDSN